VRPALGEELMIAIRDHPEWEHEAGEPVYPDNPSQLQIHLVGTARALEALGTYLIALARLDTENPEPSPSLDDVHHADGGTIRLLPRRVQELPKGKKRGSDYRSRFCR
jgi:hypothetical protein